MTAVAAIVTEPTSLVAVHDQCNKVEMWADGCDSIPELRDATNKLAAIDEYLSRTSTEGRARVAAAMRRLEVRVGKLLSPRRQGKRTDLQPCSRESEVVSRNERQDFLNMAGSEDVVEKTIADSTDDKPASRRKVINAIVGRGQPAASASRSDEMRELARKGYTSQAIATRLSIGDGYVRKVARDKGFVIPADVSVGKTQSNRKPDANRIVSTIVYELEGSRISIEMIDFADLDHDQIEGWVSSLAESIKTLQSLKARLAKELTR